MIVPLSWLRDYIDIKVDTRELARILTFSGIEVEAVTELEALPPGIVTARTISAERIAGSDHLSLCQVDAGDGVYPVVCGAPNCRSGMMAVLAKPDAVLPELTIKKARIRGVESEGMLCSEA
ncbi:MAG: phenylalanine--tRNA ligase subunit beta, partial [Candidatus Cloacimonetes bacterium]|nr:phenylalanine--tRNA ligase subunit beta [Candidatus Cloacimonadota bacterium]